MQPRIDDKVGHRLINTLTCNKLSDNAKGQLHYQLWQNNDDQSFAWALSHNESSGGFSRELIQVEHIMAVLTELDQTAQPFHATAFKCLFIGKSVNNASFFAALLVDQGVIRLHPQTTRLLEVSEEYALWPMSFDELLLDKNNSTAEVDTSGKLSSKRGAKAKVTTDMELDDAIHQN